MPLAKITGHGLAAIAFAVALLWGSVIGERLMLQRAFADRARVMRDIERLQKNRPMPASTPLWRAPRPARLSAC